MATYKISLACGDGVRSITFHTSKSATQTTTTSTTGFPISFSESDQYVYVDSVELYTGFSDELTAVTSTTTFTMRFSSGTWNDHRIDASVNGTRTATLVATKKATTTKHTVTIQTGAGVDYVMVSYTKDGDGATATIRSTDPSSRGTITADVDTNVYVVYVAVTDSTLYGAPYTATSYTAGFASPQHSWQFSSFSSGSGNDIQVNGNRYIGISATLQEQTYYGRLRLDANEGAFPGTGYTAISWPTTGVVSGTGTSGALVSITLPVAGGNYVPARDGYKFDGWVSENGSTFYSSGGLVSFTAKSTSSSNPTTLTLYAVWEEIADIELFFWNGSDTADASMIAKGKPVKTAITAARWNNLLAKTKELSDAVGVSFSYTTVSSGSEITAACFNVARTGLANIKTKLGTTTVLPAEQDSGYTVYASLFTGNGSLKSALNHMIGVYNNG